MFILVGLKLDSMKIAHVGSISQTQARPTLPLLRRVLSRKVEELKKKEKCVTPILPDLLCANLHVMLARRP